MRNIEGGTISLSPPPLAVTSAFGERGVNVENTAHNFITRSIQNELFIDFTRICRLSVYAEEQVSVKRDKKGCFV